MTSTARYPIPAGSFRHETEEQRSRFIVSVSPVADAEEARAFVAGVKAEFPDANHNCWAFVAGSPGSSACNGLSDDGEPHGTAGRPMLAALQHSGIGDVAVVVTRYFGGVKLGKGGLVRTYTRAVQEALELTPTSERMERGRLDIEIPYPLISAFKRILPTFEATALREEYGAEVRFGIELPADRVEEFVLALTEATDGKALLFRE